MALKCSDCPTTIKEQSNVTSHDMPEYAMAQKLIMSFLDVTSVVLSHLIVGKLPPTKPPILEMSIIR